MVQRQKGGGVLLVQIELRLVIVTRPVLSSRPSFALFTSTLYSTTSPTTSMSSPPSASQSPELSHSSRSGDGPAMEPDRDSMPQDAASSTEKLVSSPRPLRIYTRQHLVALSLSPLVKPPSDMPELKTWFGYSKPYLTIFHVIDCFSRIENESLMNKKDEPTTPSSARERR